MIFVPWLIVGWIGLIFLVLIGASLRAARVERMAADSNSSGAAEGAYPFIDPDHGD